MTIHAGECAALWPLNPWDPAELPACNCWVSRVGERAEIADGAPRAPAPRSAPVDPRGGHEL